MYYICVSTHAFIFVRLCIQILVLILLRALIGLISVKIYLFSNIEDFNLLFLDVGSCSLWRNGSLKRGIVTVLWVSVTYSKIYSLR